jgi:hypothetical protein
MKARFNPLRGWESMFGAFSQGSSCLATLGLSDYHPVGMNDQACRKMGGLGRSKNSFLGVRKWSFFEGHGTRMDIG